MVSVLDSGSSGLGSSSGQGHWAQCHSPPRCINGTLGKFTAGGSAVM